MKPQQERWLTKYRSAHPLYVEAADLAEILISRSLEGKGYQIHSVRGRAKDPDSASRKLEEKKYGRPTSQFTDLLGVRVISLYQSDVADIASWLRMQYRTDDKHSSDKSAALGLNRFGYRSIHLSVFIDKPGVPGSGASKLLAGTRIEVQIRSIMEHAWAEAEHELRYKSGVVLPTPVQRRFNALSAVLEVADRELDRLQDDLFTEVDVQVAKCVRGEDPSRVLDSATLIAALQVYRPNMRRLGPRRTALSFHDAADLLTPLTVVGVVSPTSLKSALDSTNFLDRSREYASANGVSPDELSALAIISVIVGIGDPNLLLQYAKLNDPQVARLFEAE